jgi:archaeal flagellar protein FlaG
MSAETFVNALFLITAVVAAGILITAVFPIVWNMASTFSTASHESDTRMRTDFKIVMTYSKGSDNTAKVWLKNIGSNRIGLAEVNMSDVVIGLTSDFNRATYVEGCGFTYPPYVPQWCYDISETPSSNGYWDPGETLQIYSYSPAITGTSQNVYFQFILPNAVWRSSEFSTT